MTSRLTRAVAVAIAAVGLSLPAPALAGDDSAPAGAASGAPGIELVSLDRSWLEPGGIAVLELAVEGAPADGDIALQAHQVLDSRIRYERIINGEEELGTTPVDTASVPLAQLSRTSAGTVAVPLAVQDPNQPAEGNRLQLRRMGTYPIEVQLRDADANVLTSFILPMVLVLPNADGSPVVGERLRVAWVWPLVAAPAREPFGRTDPAVVDELRPDGRLGRQATALASAGDVPFTVAPGPETLEAWEEFSQGDPEIRESYETMLAAANTNQVLASPYVDLNIPSLLASGFAEQVGAETAHGTTTLDAQLGTRVDRGTALVDPVNIETVSYLRPSVDRIIIDGEALAPVDVDLDYTPAQRFEFASDPPMAAAATNPGLDAPLTNTAMGSPALRAQQFLAGLSLLALELPNVARGIVVVNPDDWDPSGALVEAAINGLRGNRLLQAVDVNQFFAQVPVADDGTQDRVLRPYDPPAPPVSSREYQRAEADLNSLRSLVGADDPGVRRGELALLTSLSAAWENPDGRERAEQELGVIGFASTDVLSQVHVPVGNTVTLTARKGEIPVTFLNETEMTLRVKVHLESDKLFFPEGDVREVELPPGTSTIGFTVESRTSGTFPLELTVTSLDDGLLIQSTRLRVRSTFVSGVGVFLTVGAALFLAIWWFVHFRRNRRERAGTGTARAAGAPA